jgi:transposase-like protein
MITPWTENKEFSGILEVLPEDGLDGMPKVFEMLMNTAMKIERSRALRAEPYERTDDRKGYANGFKPKHLKSRVGMLNLQIPQVRDGVSFYPASLERGLRSDRALLLGIAEMYLNGVSTRKVTNILEELCGLEITVVCTGSNTLSVMPMKDSSQP